MGLVAEIGVLDEAKGDRPCAKVEVGDQGHDGVIGDSEKEPRQEDDREDKARADRIIPEHHVETLPDHKI